MQSALTITAYFELAPAGALDRFAAAELVDENAFAFCPCVAVSVDEIPEDTMLKEVSNWFVTDIARFPAGNKSHVKVSSQYSQRCSRCIHITSHSPPSVLVATKSLLKPQSTDLSLRIPRGKLF